MVAGYWKTLDKSEKVCEAFLWFASVSLLLSFGYILFCLAVVLIGR